MHAVHIVYIYQSRYDQALKLLKAARRIARALGDLPRRSYLMLSIGQIYNDLYDHRRALTLSRLSLRLAQESGAFYREIHARYEVGSNAMQLGRWEEALEALDAVEAAYRRLGMTRRISMPLWGKGMIYQVKGDTERCEAVFTEALELARVPESYNILAAMDILIGLGLLAQTQGDDRRALARFGEAIELTRAYELRHWQPILHARVAAIAVLPHPATILFVVTHDRIDVKRLVGSDGARCGGRGQAQAPVDLDPDKLRPSSHSDDPMLDMLRLESRIDWLSRRQQAPAEPWLQGSHHVYIIPHGPLHYVPFLALRRADGRYLLDQDGPIVTFAPSAAVLLHTLAVRRSNRRDSLSIGYNGPARNRLAHAEQEAVVIAQTIAGEAWVGPEPKSRRLLSRRQLRVLHIAGHAIYDGKRAHTTALHLGEDDVLDAGAILRTQGPALPGRPGDAQLVHERV